MCPFLCGFRNKNLIFLSKIKIAVSLLRIRKEILLVLKVYSNRKNYSKNIIPTHTRVHHLYHIYLSTF